MTILTMTRLTPELLACSFEHDGQQYDMKVKLFTEGPARGLHLLELPWEEKQRLYNAPEGLELTQALWRFVDGKPLPLPLDLTVPASS